MRRLRVAAVLLGLVASGCTSSVRLYSRTNSSLPMAALRTFAVGSVEHALPGYKRTPLGSETLEAVRADVEADFKARGYTPAPLGEAELIVCVASGSRAQLVETMERDTLGNLVARRDPDGPFAYSERTLVIDVFDRSHARRLWHGSAEDLLQPNLNRRAVARAIGALVARFPERQGD